MDAVADHAGAIVDSFAVRQALSELSPEQLAIVTLIDGEGRSYESVAALLDISAGTVASRLHRARVTLRERLDNASTIEEER